MPSTPSSSSSKRLIVWSGVCVGAGLGCWQGYRLLVRYQARRADAARQQGRDVSKNMDVVLRQLHDGPYAFVAPGSDLASEDDAPQGVDDLDHWRAAETLTSSGSSSHGSSSSSSSSIGDGDVEGSVLWSVDAPASREVSPRAVGTVNGPLPSPSAPPSSDVTPVPEITDESSTGEGLGRMHSAQLLSFQAMSTEGSTVGTAHHSSLDPASPAAAAMNNSRKAKRRRAVKAIISGVAAVLSSSEEDEREAEKVQAQQAVMNDSSKSFLHWAVGNHPSGHIPSRTDVPSRGIFLSPSSYTADASYHLNSPHMDAISVPGSLQQPSMFTTPLYPNEEYPNPHSGYHGRQPSQLSAYLSPAAVHSDTEGDARVGSFDRGPMLRTVSEAGTTGRRRTSRRRPWFRRLWRIVRRTSVSCWLRFLLPCVVRPARTFWRGVCSAWATLRADVRALTRGIAACLSRQHRHSTGSTSSSTAAAAAAASSASKPADQVEAILEPNGAIDIEAALDEILALLRPHAAQPAQVPTVAVIRVPIGYEATLETERLLTALQLDSSSREDGLVDLYVIEELKTASLLLPAATSASPTLALRLGDQTGTCSTLWERRQSLHNVAGAATTPVTPAGAEQETDQLAVGSGADVGSDPPSPNERSMTRGGAHSPLPSITTPLSDQQQQQPAPRLVPADFSSSGIDDAQDEEEEEEEEDEEDENGTDPAARLKLTYEVYPAAVFYSFLLRSAVMQMKDDLTREAAAKVFGGDPTSATLPEVMVSTGTAATGDAWRSPPATPFVTCVSPMCAPYPAPQSSSSAIFSSAAGAAPHMPQPLQLSSLGAPNLTSPNSRTFGSAAGGTVGDEPPPSPISGRAGRSASTVFFDATESLQGLGSGGAAATTGSHGDFAGSPLRRVGRTETTTTVGSPHMAHPGFASAFNRTPPTRRHDDDTWGICCMTVHVRHPQETEETPQTNAARFGAAVLSPLAGLSGVFSLPPSVVPPRALQCTGPRAVEHAPISASVTPPSIVPSAHTAMACGPLELPPLPPSAAAMISGAAAAAAGAGTRPSSELVDEPETRVRYRTRLIAAGAHNKEALGKIDDLMRRLRKQWSEVLLLLMQEAALPTSSTSTQVPPPRSMSLREFFDISPRLRPWSPHTRSPAVLHPQQQPSPRLFTDSRGPSSPPMPPRSGMSPMPKSGGGVMPLLSTPVLTHTPSVPSHAETNASRTIDTRGGGKVSLKMPDWALNGTLRRESMRETLMKELKERAFRILSLPLPDARVYRQLPPDVPRYIAAHARGFALAHSFAQEILNQQRHLQHILIGLEQRQQQLMHRREARHRRREEAWQAFHGFFTLDRSQSRQHPSQDGVSNGDIDERKARTRRARRDGGEGANRAGSDAPSSPSALEQSGSLSTQDALDETRRGGTGAGAASQHSGAQSSVSLSRYNEEAEHDGGEVAVRPSLTGASATTPSQMSVPFNGVLGSPGTITPSTPLALSPLGSSLQLGATNPTASATSGTATHSRGGGGGGGVNTEACLSLNSTGGSGGGGGAGSGTGKRQAWTTTNTSTNYNVDGRSTSPSASLGCVTPVTSRSTAGTSPQGSTSITPPAGLGMATGPCVSQGGTHSSVSGQGQHALVAERSPPTTIPPVVVQDASRSPVLRDGSTPSSPPTGFTAPGDVSTPTSSNRHGGSWTPLGSSTGDDDSSRRSNGMAPRAPNNSMYGTFDAYFGQSISAPQAVMMRHQAAGLQRVDPSSGGAGSGGAGTGAGAGGGGAGKGFQRMASKHTPSPHGSPTSGGAGGAEGALTAPSSYAVMPHAGDARGAARSGGDMAQKSRKSQQQPQQQHQQLQRHRFGSAAVLPYNYSNDSVSSMLGTNHYPFYPHGRDLSHHQHSESVVNDRYGEYHGALHNLLGSGGGAMSSGITFYYTFGNATASLYNSCLRPTPESDPWERLVAMTRRRSTHSPVAGTGTNSADQVITGGGPPINRGKTAPPAATSSGLASGNANAFTNGAATGPNDDGGPSSYLFMEPDEPDSSEEMVEEQTVLRQSRNQMFYSVYRHLHRVFTETITKDAMYPPSSTVRIGPAVPDSPAPLSAATMPNGLPALPTSPESETVTLGARTVLRSELDLQNGHYGLEPLQLWLATRYSRRFAAEVYILDVAACKSDRHYPAARVLDEVVEHAVLYYHDRRFSEFIDDLRAQFGLEYEPQTRWGRFTLGLSLDEEDIMNTIADPEKRDYATTESARLQSAIVSAVSEDTPPLSSAARRALEKQNRCADVCEKGQEEDEKLFASAFEPTDVWELDGSHNDRLLLRELDHVKEFLLDHYRVLSSALQTDNGANSLEEVFGVPAMVFAFILCARESVSLMDTIYHSIEGNYGRLTLENFSHFTHDVFAHDRPHISRHVTRIFRTLDKSRRGYFEYDELCWYMARKLSCGNNLAPDAHLLATAMSLRLPLILIIDQKYRWPELSCTLASLSDGEVDY